MLVKPAEGLRVRDPYNPGRFVQVGEDVDPADLNWSRLIRFKDVVECTPEEAEAAEAERLTALQAATAERVQARAEAAAKAAQAEPSAAEPAAATPAPKAAAKAASSTKA